MKRRERIWPVILSLILIASLLFSFFFTFRAPVFANGTHTGIVLFTDVSGNEVPYYTVGPATITLWDADLNTNAALAEQAAVTVTGTTQIQPEPVTLTETGADTGVFRGNIALDAVSGVSAVDGDLDVKPSDDLLVQYNDAADDYGNAAVAEDSTPYAPVTYQGHITTDTTWTTSNSPYIISGDLTVDSGFTLTIEPGVTVKFVANYDDQNGGQWNTASELFINGHLVAPGTLANPIIFTSTATTPQPGDWGKIMFQNGGTAAMTYCQVKYGKVGICSSGSSVVDLTDCLVDQCINIGIDISGADCHGIILRTTVQNCAVLAINISNGSDITLRNCVGSANDEAALKVYNANPLIENCSFTNTATPNGNNPVSAIFVLADSSSSEIPQAIRGCTISGSYYGLKLWWKDIYQDPPATLLVDNCTIGGQVGVTVWNRAKVIMHGCDLSGSAIRGIENDMYDQDCRYNYWGTNATTQMNAGGNPKNIAFIWDKYDDPAELGYVIYTGWLTSPQNQPTITSVIPNQGAQGTILNVSIAGTHLSGATLLDFGPGVSVNSFSVDNDSQITANISINTDATLATRNVSVTTPGGTGTLPNGFTVLQPSQGVTTSTGTGTATFSTNNGSITGLSSSVSTPCGTLPGYNSPHGFFSFNIINIPPGSTVTITITLPSTMPINTQYWKCINGQWINCTSLLGDNDGDNILTLTLTDGSPFDADGLANGTIVDPGGPVVVVATSPAAPAGLPAAHRASPTPPTQLNLAQMSLQYLSLTPQQTSANQLVTITTNVVNTGDEAGNLNVALKINGQVEQTRMVSVGPHGTQPVKFAVAKAQPGTYSVDIGGQKGSFTILSAGSHTTASTTNNELIGILIIGALIIATVVVLMLILRRITG